MHSEAKFLFGRGTKNKINKKPDDCSEKPGVKLPKGTISESNVQRFNTLVKKKTMFFPNVFFPVHFAQKNTR